MWKRPWGVGEGISICCGLVVVGLVLQLCVGSIDWSLFARPLNFSLFAAYVLALVVLYAVRRHIYFVSWSLTYGAAIPSIAFVVVATLLMGLIRQEPNGGRNVAEAVHDMLSFWPFVLLYAWMTTVVGWAALKNVFAFNWRKFPALLNHLGLFVVLVCGTLGSADMKRVTLTSTMGLPEWRAVDEAGKIQELPLAIELEDFTIEEYPPKLMLIDNFSGKPLPEGLPEQMVLEEGISTGEIAGWEIRLTQMLETAAPTATCDTVYYIHWPSMGATNAAHLEATNLQSGEKRSGWVSNGSFLFPYQSLHLDSLQSVVMPERDPRKYLSHVKIYTQSGTISETDIEVNKPAKAEGWKIYQLDYDREKGRWSTVSVFELVKDPWLPAVYVGIGLMFLGAILMFVTSPGSRKEG